ncbi:MAG: transposase [Actinobacteria bacterium]|nr:transposase [Actinomycetota bacterium]
MLSPQYTLNPECLQEAISSKCGHTESENRTIQAKFECKNCGHWENADINAAKNILAAGLAVFACGGGYGVSQPMKQEPTMSKIQASECA